jgi:nitrogen fixation protein FixH
MNTVPPRIEPWPIGIAAFFAMLISALATWAVVAQRNREELVSADYYEQEVAYQQPSEAALDRDLPLAIGRDGVQSIEALTLKPGLWKVRVHWGAEASGYYVERSVVVPSVDPGRAK